MFSRSGGHKTKETYPTRPGSPTPCKQGLSQFAKVSGGVLQGILRGGVPPGSRNLACVASVSNRVMARKLEREQKKGAREKGEEETLARKPHDSGKRALIFHGSVRSPSPMGSWFGSFVH